MNMFWLGVAGGSLLTTHLLILVFLRWRTGTTVHGVLSVPRFELFLLILMIPCMCQSSVFIIRGISTNSHLFVIMQKKGKFTIKRDTLPEYILHKDDA